MSKSPLLLLLFVLFSCGERPAADQKKKEAPGLVTDTLIEPPLSASNAAHPIKNREDIKRAYRHVSSQLETNSLDSTSFSYNCHGEKKGKVIYFSDQTGLRLVKHTYDEYSHFSATDEYFVNDDSLFFVVYKHVSWSFDPQAHMDGQTIDKVTESRFYIIKNKALQCLEKKYTIRSASSEKMQPRMAANRETDCSTLNAVLNKFELLMQYQDLDSTIECLDE